jgi:hypothetical protein
MPTEKPIFAYVESKITLTQIVEVTLIGMKTGVNIAKEKENRTFVSLSSTVVISKYVFQHGAYIY